MWLKEGQGISVDRIIHVVIVGDAINSINDDSKDCDLVYFSLYNSHMDARALFGQSDVVYCASKPTEKSRVFWIIV